MSGGGYEFAFDGEAASAREAALRVIAHFMVFAMPPSGLDETVSSLGEIVEFHNERIVTAPPALEPARKFGSGKVVDVRDRSPLTLAD